VLKVSSTAYRPNVKAVTRSSLFHKGKGIEKPLDTLALHDKTSAITVFQRFLSFARWVFNGSI
jgi:hypothetical protein